ncbi:AraC family transcriptional regulator [Acidocella sp. KAb 2-4]|uniref:AraC family transcriptional regulator n=1 Tax=Acidocella sp. KAb 2-4 TaxID=2885158 RepID=UPI001D08D39F|nr:AraC family transcriptional regulator [Acidocella sp. KAb 2-4]MCB5944269.1 AraC family transcriptional regulator [Acidocella sp. KAb 2-4]
MHDRSRLKSSGALWGQGLSPDGQDRPGGQLSETLLSDLRVIEARVSVVELGGDAAAIFPDAERPVLHVVLEGGVWLAVGGQQAPAMRLESGETALVFYGDRHSLGTHPRRGREEEVVLDTPPREEPRAIPVGNPPAVAVVMSCVLELAYMSPAARAVRAAPAVLLMTKTGAPPHDRALAGDPAQWLEALRGPGASAFGSMLASLCFVHSMRGMYHGFWRDQPMEIRAPSTRWVNAAVILLHTRPDRPWTVASLAHEVGVSRSRFAAGFAAIIGMPPLAYLTRIRMMRAIELLEAGDIPFAEIARRTGYPVQSSFTRAFVAFHGVSPTEFAAQQRQTRRRKGGAGPSA